MARFLTSEWFEELEAAYQAEAEGAAAAKVARAGAYRPGNAPGAPGQAATAALVVEIFVAGAPQGEVRYQVVVEGERVRVVPPGAEQRTAQVRLRSDYATLAGIASGELSAIDALSLGRARISGDTGALGSRGTQLAGLDLVPAAVRARTVF
ncbi:MAG TPA: SCP2 sterol-binding domain-containing protein [Acidimicrobiales bacterium]|nr:SCP2 sterol-binding domain-containing protein [Acidimicrobiales bacterium]